MPLSISCTASPSSQDHVMETTCSSLSQRNFPERVKVSINYIGRGGYSTNIPQKFDLEQVHYHTSNDIQRILQMLILIAKMSKRARMNIEDVLRRLDDEDDDEF